MRVSLQYDHPENQGGKGGILENPGRGNSSRPIIWRAVLVDDIEAGVGRVRDI